MKLLISINKEVYAQIMETLKKHNKPLYEVVENLSTKDTLAIARTVKSEKIKSSIRELLQDNPRATKYQINKSTGIAYATLNKYYENIKVEVTA